MSVATPEVLTLRTPEASAALAAAGHDPEWWRAARCGNAAPGMFFPRDERKADPDDLAAVTAGYCARCPVIEACRTEADATREIGLWAGAYRRGKGDGATDGYRWDVFRGGLTPTVGRLERLNRVHAPGAVRSHKARAS